MQPRNWSSPAPGHEFSHYYDNYRGEHPPNVVAGESKPTNLPFLSVADLVQLDVSVGSVCSHDHWWRISDEKKCKKGRNERSDTPADEWSVVVWTVRAHGTCTGILATADWGPNRGRAAFIDERCTGACRSVCFFTGSTIFVLESGWARPCGGKEVRRTVTSMSSVSVDTLPRTGNVMTGTVIS